MNMSLPHTATDRPSPVLWRGDEAVARAAFISTAQNMAQHLQQRGSAGKPMVVLAHKRGAFLTGFYGALLAGCDVLLPNDATQHTLGHLARQYPGVACLCDEECATAERSGLEAIAIVPFEPSAPALYEVPRLPDPAPSVTVFTSGSTGTPVGHAKPWRALVAGVAHWAQRLNLGDGPASIVATVPPQHMYGLEASVLLPLIRPDTAVLDTRPFYPADICDALKQIDDRRVLVTTPLHLSTLVKSNQDLPRLHAIVSATAPLSPELAAQAEDLWGAPVLEVYGSSETGMLATRRSARDEAFTLRDDFTLSQRDGENLISGEHLQQPVSIPDVLSLTENGFVFQGRGDDLINVAGKRASLSGLNAILNTIPGVEDGAFHIASTTGQVERPIAFVVAPNTDQDAIKAALRTRIPDVFIPRRFVFLDALPRNATGKLPRQALDSLLEATTEKPNILKAGE